jgi:hypothetical protein
MSDDVFLMVPACADINNKAKSISGSACLRFRASFSTEKFFNVFKGDGPFIIFSGLQHRSSFLRVLRGEKNSFSQTQGNYWNHEGHEEHEVL